MYTGELSKMYKKHLSRESSIKIGFQYKSVEFPTFSFSYYM